jgi:hypothetical protein
MATTTKVDMDKCSSLVLYKTMAKIRDEINDRMVFDPKRKPHAVSIMADAVSIMTTLFLRLKIIFLIISIDADGFSNFRDWSDTDLCNNKTILEALGITKGILPASTYVDHKGDDVPIPMLMTGVEFGSERLCRLRAGWSGSHGRAVKAPSPPPLPPPPPPCVKTTSLADPAAAAAAAAVDEKAGRRGCAGARVGRGRRQACAAAEGCWLHRCRSGGGGVAAGPGD